MLCTFWSMSSYAGTRHWSLEWCWFSHTFLMPWLKVFTCRALWPFSSAESSCLITLIIICHPSHKSLWSKLCELLLLLQVLWFPHFVLSFLFEEFSMIFNFCFLETAVFAYLGLGIFSFPHKLEPALVIWSIVLCLFGRMMNIFPLAAMVNRFREHKITKKMMFIMWFSGLRGAIAYALSLHLEFETETRRVLVTTTLIIVLFTILVLGGSTMPLLKFIKSMYFLLHYGVFSHEPTTCTIRSQKTISESIAKKCSWSVIE